MKKIKKPKAGIDDIEYVKINRALSRQEEINKYGKQLHYNHIVETKKLYTRKVKHKKQLEEL